MGIPLVEGRRVRLPEEGFPVVLVLVAFFVGLGWKFMYGEGAWQVAE